MYGGRDQDQKGQRLRIAVSGGSGLVGTNLVAFLTAAGHEVVRLVRRPVEHEGEVYWNPREKEIEAARLEGLDAVVHLSNDRVFAGRWTEEKKMRVIGSRVHATRFMGETLARLERPPKVFVSPSTIGLYGDRGDEVLTEASAPGQKGFLAAIAQDWEAATQPAAEVGIRTVCLRLGVLLSPRAGALRFVLPAFRMGLGGRFGPKDQYISWIDPDDIVGALWHCLKAPDLAGPVNLTAPNPVTMEAFAQTLAEVLSRPAALTFPAPLVRAVAGEAVDQAFLASTRVLPERLLETGYAFQYPDLEDALRHQLGRVPEPVEV